MTIIASKIEKTKLKNYFTELKVRGQLKSKFTTFKSTHLFSRLSSLYSERLKQSFAKISLFGKKKLQNLRRISRIEKLIATKAKNYLLTGFLKLRINVYQLKAKDEKEKEDKIVEEKVPTKPAPVQQNNDRENEAEIKKLEAEQKNLTERKKNLERDYTKLEGDSEKMLNDFRKEIKRLES